MQASSVLCRSISSRSVTPSGAASASGGTSFGGRGSFSPSTTSLSQLPRRIGLVRDAPEFLYPAYAVYPEAADPKILTPALTGLRHVAKAHQRVKLRLRKSS